MKTKRSRRRRTSPPVGTVPAYIQAAPHRHTDRTTPNRGMCRVCDLPVLGRTRKGRLRYLHTGRRLPDGIGRETDCRNAGDSPCRLCKAPVQRTARDRRPRFWHRGRRLDDGTREPDCATLHRIRYSPKFAKAFIAKRDGRKCKQCSAKRGTEYLWLHLDHKTTIRDGRDQGLGTADLMDADNLQLLCPDCHKAKTSIENSSRAKRRRLDREALAIAG